MKGANAMGSFVALTVGAGLLLASFGALLVVHGGWEAVAAAFACVGGPMFLVSFIVLGVAADRGPSGRPR
jgi:hypothetical protein